MKKEIYFFIGTEAELIKVFPVMLACMENDAIVNVIASGQNDLNKSRILKGIKLNGNLLELSYEADIKRSALGLLGWFIKTHSQAVKKIKQQFGDTLTGKLMVVHGDTVSTLMGAHLGRKMGCTVCHIEAGLRSHHLTDPFPEEIDRLLTSRLARLHFAPGDEAVSNLKKAKGKVVNTGQNTILDSLAYSQKILIKEERITELLKEDYFVFVMHRQENLMNKKLVQQVLQIIEKISCRKKCVMILHKITETTLQKMDMLQDLEKNTNFTLLPRVDYFDFMKLLEGSQYVITDGGSNQEELYYMGKPCLILRKNTERLEGIGENALLYNGNLDEIEAFADSYKTYERHSLVGDCEPSEIIAEELMKNIQI